jgi:putative transposase
MRRTFRYLLRPTARQSAALAAMLDDHRELYNAALQERRDAWRMRQVSVRYGEQSAQLRDIRRADPDGQGRWSFSSQQATLRRLGRAFDAFFGRVQAGRTPGFPRFKGAGWFDTVEWPSDRDGCRWDSTAGEHRLYLQGVGHIRVHQHREVRGRVKTISVKRDNQRWYVLLSCDDVPPEPLERTGSVVGIDLGVTSFLTTSDGVHVPNLATSNTTPAGLPPRSGLSLGVGGAALGVRGHVLKSLDCTVRCAASGSTTRTRSRLTWCVGTT